MTHYCLNVNKRRVNAEHDVLDTAKGLRVEWQWRHLGPMLFSESLKWNVIFTIESTWRRMIHSTLAVLQASWMVSIGGYMEGQSSRMQKTWQINFFTNLVSATAVNHRLHEYNRLVQPFKGLGSFIKRARSINHAKGWAEGGGVNIVGTELV